MLEVSHNTLLALASLFIALMASFTGFSLVKGASEQTLARRKVTVAMAAIALGGGIWAMHFVAMLGLQLPVLFFYDTLITLASALIAILIVGIALLILHFRSRSAANVTIAGAIIGLGIPAMHYVGMYGIQLCRVSYTPLGIFLAVTVSLLLSVGAIWIAYGKRTHRNIVLGTLCFGGAVFTVHFAAIGGTRFWEATESVLTRPQISNEALAIIVLLISFLICAAFLLSGITFLPAPDTVRPKVDTDAPAPSDTDEIHAASSTHGGQVPYEQDGRTHFADRSQIAVVRAEGHYTVLYVGDQKLFCPWSISEAESRLPEPQFIRAHRSYLINPTLVSSFERRKDNGVCFFDMLGARLKVPVSRSRLPLVRATLGV